MSSLCATVSSDPLACQLFTYNGHVIAFDLIGAGIPLLVSAVVAVVYLGRGHWKINLRHTALLLLFSTILGGVATLEFTVSGWLYGGLALQTQFFLYSTLYPAGALVFLFFDREGKENVSVWKPYVLGTVGMVLSDIFRTFSGALTVSPQIIGAGEIYDGVFLGGIFMLIAYMMAAFFYFRFWKPLRKSTS